MTYSLTRDRRALSRAKVKCLLGSNPRVVRMASHDGCARRTGGLQHGVVVVDSSSASSSPASDAAQCHPAQLGCLDSHLAFLSATWVRVFPNRPSLLRNYGLPARRIREKPIQATEMQGVFCWDSEGIVPATWPNHPAFPRNCQREGKEFASDCQQQATLRRRSKTTLCLSGAGSNLAPEFRAVFAFSDSAMSGRDKSSPNFSCASLG